MGLIAHDPAPPRSPSRARVARGLLARADVITLHCALTERLAGWWTGAALACQARRHLVNVARGEVVESEDVLAEALVSGRLSAVALDVFPRSRRRPATASTPTRA